MIIDIPQCTVAPTKRCFLPWRSRGGKCQTRTRRCQTKDSLRPRCLQIPSNGNRHQWQQVYVSVLMFISWLQVPSQPVARLPVPKHAQLFIMPLTHEVWSQPSDYDPSTPLYTTYAVHMNSGKSWMQDWTTMLSLCRYSAGLVTLAEPPSQETTRSEPRTGRSRFTDLRPHNLGHNSAWKYAEDRSKWHPTAEKAPLCDVWWLYIRLVSSSLEQPKCFHNVLAQKRFTKFKTQNTLEKVVVNLWQVIRLHISVCEILDGDAFELRTEDGTHNLLLSKHKCTYTRSVARS